MRRERERRGQVSPVVASLLAQIFHIINSSPYKPPVTIFFLGVNIFIHVHPYPEFLGFDLHDVQQNCIHPRKIVNSIIHSHSPNLPLHRIIFGSLMHGDDMHLYYNMLSLTWKGLQLESQLGSAGLLMLILYAILSSGLIMVTLSYALVLIGSENFASYNICSIGFSGVLFCLKYVLNFNAPSMTRVMGLDIPTKHAAWAELVAISLVTPNASFLGHLAGILAGVIYLHGNLEKYFKIIERIAIERIATDNIHQNIHIN